MKNFSKIIFIFIFIALLFENTSHAAIVTVDYTYDNLNRLTQIEYGNGDIISYTYDAAGNRVTKAIVLGDTTPPMTTAEPLGGTFISSIQVTFSSDAIVIWYTIDGSDPIAGESPIYAYPIPINTNTTLKFFGMDMAENPETIKTETYTFNPTPTIISGLPSATTADQNFTITISGNGVLAYKYSLDGGAWSEETPDVTPIELVNMAEGLHQLEVIGKDAYGNWQDTANATVSNWEINIVLTGDINDDGNIDLADAVLALQVACRIPVSQSIYQAADVNDDGKIGVEEAIYIIEKISGIRD